MCTFSLAVSIGTALLLPFSIVTNEILILYPDSYYIQWLNDSLIQSLWSYVFVFSNTSLFILLPFAYFFTESEGFSGSRKGIMARVNETFVLLALLTVLVFGITYVISRLFGYNDLGFSNLFTLWIYLPFLYSCVSFFGVLLLLLCTPLGIVNLFTVLGEYITKPHLLRNTQEEYEEAILERLSLHRKLEHAKSFFTYSFINNMMNKSNSMPSLNHLDKQSSHHHNHQHVQHHYYSPLNNSCQSSSSFISPITTQSSNNSYISSPKIDEIESSISKLDSSCRELERKLRMGWIRRNFGYPVAMILLMCLTALASLIVVQNTLGLLVGIKALPKSSAQEFVLGITSLSKMGIVGAGVEISLILYLWCASLVGLYTLPWIGKLRPKLHDTHFTKIIANCAVILVLSSALPLLSRTVGITNFDLLGDFGRIEWLGNFYVVLFYNVVFAITTALCLTTKIVTAVSREFWKRIKEFSNWIRDQLNYFSGKNHKIINLNVNINGSPINGSPNINLHAKFE